MKNCGSFIISAQTIRLWVLVITACWSVCEHKGVLTSNRHNFVLSRNKKNRNPNPYYIKVSFRGGGVNLTCLVC